MAEAEGRRPGFIDRFLPERLRSGGAADYDRAQLVVACSFAMGVWGPIFAAVYVWLGLPSLILPTLAAGLAALALPFLLRATGARRLCAGILCAEVFALLVYSAWSVNGWSNGALWWISAIPVLATILLGPRAGVVFAALSFVVYGGFHCLYEAGFAPAFVMSQRVMALIYMLAMSGLTVALLSFAVAFDLSKRQGFARLTAEIAERRCAEDKLRRSEARLAAAQRIARIGSWEWDLATDEVTVSAAVRRMLGIAPEAPVSREALQGWIHPEDLPGALEASARSMAQGTRLSLDHRIVLSGGETRVVHVEAESELGERGEVVRRTGVIQDVTERKRAEEALDEAQEKLRHAQKMEAIGRLAGGVAHDFNNLLSVIQGYAELAQTAASDPALAADIGEISGAARRAAELTGRLLAFSRKQTLQARVADLNEIVGGMERLLRSVIGEDVALVVRLAPRLGAVRVDPGQMEQVLMNLAVNARDAMPDGGALTLATAEAELDRAYADGHAPLEPGRYVMLAVSDTGVGMDAATLARVFEPFFTTKEPGKGTGLGLATVYGIVNQHGGHVWAYSEPGRGTTFKIYLPRAEGEPEPLQAEAPARPEERGGAETVLVVEDSIGVRELARRVLERAGYRVLTAANGAEALASFAGDAVDLLLTDVIMPEMDGPTLARRFAEARPGLRVLFMSGYTDDALGRHGIVGPSIHYLAKPFSQRDLLRKVREVLDGPVGEA